MKKIKSFLLVASCLIGCVVLGYWTAIKSMAITDSKIIHVVAFAIGFVSWAMFSIKLEKWLKL